ncbi:MAG TPA: hypothetical protein ENI76_05015 [Ignavibacteria bacterium]|nr:hypothetical protein [Ignavibacteria bacterium]
MMKTLYSKMKISNKNKLLITVSILILFTIEGCKDSGTDVQPVKDPRNYSWSVDTLAFPNSAQTLMRNLWGSSAKDVYAVGWNNQAFGQMWHYDGTSWTDVKLHVFQGGNIGGTIGLLAISGISGSNIWAVGNKVHSNPTPPPNFLNNHLIINYDGTSWKEISFKERGFLPGIYVQSSSNIWASGDSTIYHYDGVKWTREHVPLVIPANSSLYISKIISTGIAVYATGTLQNNNTGDVVFYFFKRDEKGWRIVETSLTPFSFGLGGFWLSPSGKLYSVGRGLFVLNGSTWSNVFYSTTNFSGVYGTSDTNIFIAGTDGSVGIVYHYNGQDWKKLDQLTANNILYTSVWTDGTEAFISGFTLSAFPQKTIIWHGK